MHTRGVVRVFVVLAMLGGGLGGVPAHAASPDWALARVHFPSGGEAAVEGTAVANGAGPVVIGLGSTFGGGGGFVDVFDVGNGGISLKTTDTLGSVAIQVTPPSGGTFHVGMGVGLFSKSPADIDLLVFVANASFTTVSSHASGGTVQPTSGSGTQAIYVAGPGTSGIAADASVAAAGTSTTARQVAAGLVGAATQGCLACTMGWTSPDGKSGSTTEANVPFPPLPPPPPLPVPLPVPFLPGGVAIGDPAFAGPAGSWQWSWTGATVNLNPSTAVVGAYAPIGDAWRDFRGGTTGGSAGGGNSFGGSGGSVGGGSGSSHPSTHVAGKHVSQTLANTGVESDAVAWMLLLMACVVACRLRRVTS